MAEESIEILWDQSTHEVLYMPTFNGKRLNTFTLEQNQSNPNFQAVFVDPTNKTLKKLVYTLKSHSILNIRLLGNGKDGRPFDIEYDMHRDIYRCPATP